MSSGKTNKSFTKRLKITRNGRVMARAIGKNHFNAKQSRSKQLDHKRMRDFAIRQKLITQLVPNN